MDVDCSTDLLTAARGYLDLGLKVLALSGKAPNTTIHRRGALSAFGDPNVTPPVTLEQAFSRPATTGVGILTSYPYIVVDVDGEQGAVNWRDLVGQDDFMPEKWVARTARGLHIWYGSVEPVGSIKLAEQLDLKGEGGYVAAPPSIHPSGFRYEWLSPPTPDGPHYLPDALRDRIRRYNFEREGRMVTRAQYRPIHQTPFEGGRLWANTCDLAALARGVRSQRHGNRNNYLAWAAMEARDAGVALEDAFAELAQAGVEAGLTWPEVYSVIRSAYNRVPKVVRWCGPAVEQHLA